MRSIQLKENIQLALRPINIVSILFLILLPISYLFKFMSINIETTLSLITNSIFTQVQIVYILIIAITVLQLLGTQDLLMRVSAYTAISIIPFLSIIQVSGFFFPDIAYFQRLYYSSQIIIYVYSLVITIFFTFIHYIDTQKEKVKIFSIGGFIWSAIIILFLFTYSPSLVLQYVISVSVLLLTLSLIFLFAFFKEKFMINQPTLSYRLFLIFIFVYQFGFLKQITEPYSIGVSVSHFYSLLGYIFGFFAIIKSIGSVPKRILEENLQERELVITSLHSIVRHDAANHLSAALGFMEIAEDANSWNYIQKAAKSVYKTKDLLDSSSDLSQKFVGRKKSMVLLENLLKQIIDEVKESVLITSEKEFQYEVDIIDLHIDENPVLVGAIKNIIENAIKYSKDGFVKIDVITELINQKNNKRLKISISDYGKGINPVRQKKLLFAPVNSDSGHGIGLYLYNLLINKMLNGELLVQNRVEDDYEKGTTVIISIPLTELN